MLLGEGEIKKLTSMNYLVERTCLSLQRKLHVQQELFGRQQMISMIWMHRTNTPVSNFSDIEDTIEQMFCTPKIENDV